MLRQSTKKMRRDGALSINKEQNAIFWERGKQDGARPVNQSLGATIDAVLQTVRISANVSEMILVFAHPTIADR